VLREYTSRILSYFNDMSVNPLEMIFTESEFSNWHAFQAVMMGVGIMGFGDFNAIFREDTMRTAGGAINSPLKSIDIMAAMRIFDDMVERSSGIRGGNNAGSNTNSE